MQINRNGNGGTPLEAGTYVACLDHIYDLGLQAPPEGFKTKEEQPKYKQAFRFHIEREDGDIYRLSSIVTDSTGEKSRFREVVRALRGSDLTRDEINSGTFDDNSIIGRSCLIRVRVKNGNGSEKPAIDSYTALPKGMQAIKRVPETEIPRWVEDMLAARLDKPVVKVAEPEQPSVEPEAVVADEEEDNWLNK